MTARAGAARPPPFSRRLGPRARRDHAREDRPHLVALHLARRRARQRRVVEVHDRRPLRRRAARRWRAREARAARALGARRAGRPPRRRPPGPRGTRSARRRRDVDADDRELRDVRRPSPSALLDVVGVHVLAGRRDDHVLHAPDDLEAALLVELARGRRCGASPRRRSPARGRLVVRVAGHHVRAARDDLADAVGRRAASIRSSTPGIGLPTPASTPRRRARDTVSTGAASVSP